MRVIAAPKGASLDTSLPSHSSLPLMNPTGTGTRLALLATLLAYHGNQPVGGLQLVSSGPFQAHATRLCIVETRPPIEEEKIALELLRHASRNVIPLRGGGALLARAESQHEALLLERGFNHSAPHSEGAVRELFFCARRPPGELCEASHAALQVSDIRASMAFFSLLNFEESLRFNSAGARCAWLSAPWSSLSIELIEVPALVLRSAAGQGVEASTGAAATTSDDALRDAKGSTGAGASTSTGAGASTGGTVAKLGLAHLSLDLTAVCGSLSDFLVLLQQRSEARFGKRLAVLTAPHQHMMGVLVVEAVVVRAPGGVRLELLRKISRLEGIKADW